MSTSSPTTSSSPFRLSSVALILGIPAAALGGYLLWQTTGWFGTGRGNASEYVTETAHRGSLRVTVTERGQTASLSNVTLSSRVEGTSTIISIVPEGTLARGPVLSQVAGEVADIRTTFDDDVSDSDASAPQDAKAEENTAQPDDAEPTVVSKTIVVETADGEQVPHVVEMADQTRIRVKVGDPVDIEQPLAEDLLCELDSSELNEEYKEQVIKLKQAEADLVKAKANVTIQQSQNLSDEAAAELAKTVAELDLKKYLGETGARIELERFLAARKERNSALDVASVLREFRGDADSLADRYAPLLDETATTTAEQTTTDEAATETAAGDSGFPGGEVTVEDRMDEEGEFVQQRNELLGAVTVAEEDLARAREVFEFTKRLARKGYKSLNDVEADRIAVTKARIALSVAREKLGLLDEFSRSRTSEEMLANFVEAVAAMERTDISGAAALEAYEKELEARENALEIETSKHDRLKQQLEACLIFAPSDGVVVYANQTSRRSNDNVVIEEGATVRERQSIINLPDLGRMKVDAQIHESQLGLINENGRTKSFETLDANGDGSLGPTELPEWTWNALASADLDANGRIEFDEYTFPVSLRVDSFPGERFLGRFKSLASVPSPSDWMRPNLKQYEAVIEIVDTRGRELKPGMTAVVEVLVQHRPDALQIPVQAVVSIGSDRHCWVLGDDGPERRSVRVGAASTTSVEILEGVEEGEVVVMNPRTHFSKELEELQAGARGKESGGKGEKGKGPGGRPRPGGA